VNRWLFCFVATTPRTTCVFKFFLTKKLQILHERYSCAQSYEEHSDNGRAPKRYRLSNSSSGSASCVATKVSIGLARYGFKSTHRRNEGVLGARQHEEGKCRRCKHATPKA
jgi:hypothetical protein